MKGVVDRIVDGKWAVILVGEDEAEYNVPLEELPEEIKEGNVVQVKIVNGSVAEVLLLEGQTAAKQSEINDKMSLLQARKRSNFKRG
ncbi:DUF3006 domain-containing protein [Anaerobacillus isosaccharinicus]|uniref:DUF3006 domain-containing protein n=1 Tax=Anaerobacillus isosaccharinicus TaxID=1532552 RepID=A0A1S2LXN8_9BACI|nr:DUF3006 domain-containing protein [Anaerobacillus isosaccharinicus]MBA5588389.1 DUF3006 domain-containing protein [Anaerobacillus isosaccharinicus]QOY38179.1 DUF3006 domain-containing protein [Anaerobacillus isosaccharinicus]